MRQLGVPIVILISLLLTSCEKTVVQYVEVPDGDGKAEDTLHISIDTVYAVQNTPFTLKARMSSRPLSDVRITIEYGDGHYLTALGGDDIIYTYTLDGRFTVTVTASDRYTDSILVRKTIPAFVTPVEHQVMIVTQDVDTTLSSLVFGSVIQINFTASTNAYAPTYIFRYGDGQTDTGRGSQNWSSYNFYRSLGTYIVELDVYNNGVYWGSDTITVTIRLEEVPLALLQSAINITLAYSPDTTSAIWDMIRYNSPLFVGIRRLDDFSLGEWTDSNFRFTQWRSSTDHTGDGISLYEISGRIELSKKSLTSLRVSVYDSIPSPTGSEVTRFGFTAYDLQLIARSRNHIVYRIAGSLLRTGIRNEYFTFKNKKTTILGEPTGDIVSILQQQSASSYLYVLFLR